MNIILFGTLHRLKNALQSTGNTVITYGFGNECDCAKQFDFVFVAQKDYVAPLQKWHVKNNVMWLPLFCKTGKDKKLSIPKEHDVSFVGNINKERNPRRAELITALRERVPIFCTTGTYVDVFNKSKIVLNQSVKDDINSRTFEAMACGSFLLTDRVGNGLSDLFTDKKHLVLYEQDNIDQLVALIEYYLDHDQERETIALQGMRETMEKHTDICRARTIIDTVSAVGPEQTISRRKKTRFLLKRHAARMYSTLLFQYDYPNELNSFFFSQGTRLISKAFDHNLSAQNLLQVLQDAVVYGELLITNGFNNEGVTMLKRALSLRRDIKTPEIDKLKTDINARIKLAGNLKL